jgi:hypothetical protein
MKRIAIFVAALVTFAAVPAMAQRNSSGVSTGGSHGDWWLVDKYTDRGQAVLVDGEPRARPDGTTPYIAYLMYATPKENGEIGEIVPLIVHCEAKTVQSSTFGIIYANDRIESTMGVYSAPTPLKPESALYRFACVTDRSNFRHLPNRVLSDIVTEIFAPAPRN